MQPSPACSALIKRFEGLYLVPYKDPVGLMTWGYGHKQQKNEPWPPYLSLEQAEDLLAKDIAITWQQISSAVLLVPNLTQDMVDALTSFAFNLGARALLGSTLMVHLKAGLVDLAADEFARWNHAAGKVLAGLTARREAERELFLS